MENRELYHYGVLGMKWGVRRYQNKDGTLTSEGRKRAREEYRSDNKEAFEKGKSATITERASDIAVKRASIAEGKLNKAYEKDPQGVTNRTKKLKEKYEDKQNASDKLSELAKRTRSDAEQHCKDLIAKYGEEAVKPITYDKNGHINESVNTLGDYAKAGAFTMTSRAVAAMFGVPIAFIYYPMNKNSYARQVADDAIRDARIERKNKAGD